MIDVAEPAQGDPVTRGGSWALVDHELDDAGDPARRRHTSGLEETAEPTLARPGGPTRAARGFEAFAEGTDRALAATGPVEYELGLAGRIVRLRLAGAALAPLLLPSLAHALQPSRGETPDLTIDAWDSATSGVSAPPFPWRARDVRERGEIAGFNDDEIQALFHGDLLAPEADFRAVSLFSRPQRRALLWVLSPERVPWWERAAPLRTILHWGLARNGGTLVHAAAVGNEDRGLLLAGPGGSGKSTTAVACVEAGLRCAGDDYVALAGVDPTLAHPLYGSAKLAPTSVALLPDLHRSVRSGHPVDGEKLVVDLARRWPVRMARPVPVDALVVVRVGHAGPATLRRASGAEALRALAPTTIFQLPGRNGHVLRRLAGLARTLPTFELEVSGPPQRAAELLGDLLSDGLTRRSSR